MIIIDKSFYFNYKSTYQTKNIFKRHILSIKKEEHGKIQRKQSF